MIPAMSKPMGRIACWKNNLKHLCILEVFPFYDELNFRWPSRFFSRIPIRLVPVRTSALGVWSRSRPWPRDRTCECLEGAVVVVWSILWRTWEAAYDRRSTRDRPLPPLTTSAAWGTTCWWQPTLWRTLCHPLSKNSTQVRDRNIIIIYSFKPIWYGSNRW